MAGRPTIFSKNAASGTSDCGSVADTSTPTMPTATAPGGSRVSERERRAERGMIANVAPSCGRRGTRRGRGRVVGHGRVRCNRTRA
eukprot:4994660-Prymnesium_polylepis.1